MTVANSKKSTGKRTLTAGRKPQTLKEECQLHADTEQLAEGEITVDQRRRRDRRGSADRRQKQQPVAVERRALERRAKVSRRRQIDPTTCERDYSLEEVEFMNALDQYKRSSGRMFPTCSEILEVIRGLGYTKPASIDAAAPAESTPVATAEAAPMAEPTASLSL